MSSRISDKPAVYRQFKILLIGLTDLFNSHVKQSLKIYSIVSISYMKALQSNRHLFQ
jgi:hypothetical protein